MAKKAFPVSWLPQYLHLPLSLSKTVLDLYRNTLQRMTVRYRVSSGIVPADCELIFEVHILEADGIQCAKELCERLAPAACSANGDDVCHPWWLARVESLVWTFETFNCVFMFS